ncbi:MAG: sigma 54-interacting transcriptional regulator, partial [Desulfatibacillum sp.]|nr:sigma 54-interacting transcriptional regulator [Desulfatibacillum sp.]
MKADEANFFKEATLRITSTLEIEKALFRCFDFVRCEIPADSAFLTFYNQETAIVTVIAGAREEGGRVMDLQIPFSPQSQAAAAVPDTLPEAILANKAETHALVGQAVDYMDGDRYSALLIGLNMDGRRLGGLSLWAKGHDRFSQTHLDLLMLLQQPMAIAFSNSMRHRELKNLKDILAEDNRYLQRELNPSRDEKIIGADFGLKNVMDQARRVSPLNSPVMLLGETGVGKGLIAGVLHSFSARRNGPFVSINCGAIPETLIDSELFGHEKGAFTGALERKRGRFERAQHGTIFLDEIGELPPEAQVRLLKVIEDKEITRVGGTKAVGLDIRVIAATHRNLEDMIRQGLFREDLYFRLMVFPISIPPLRNRKEDIPALVNYVLRKKAREMDLSRIPALAPGAMERLTEYDWPGNVRDLENAVERALITSQGEPLGFIELTDFPLMGCYKRHPNALEPNGPELLNLDSVIAAHIRKVLAMTDGKVAGKGG